MEIIDVYYRIRNMLFPIVICDNFFDDPDSVAKFGKSLPYKKGTKINGIPGVRTDSLHLVDKEFFMWLTKKSLKLIYPTKDVGFVADGRFQKIPVNLDHDGWVHVDKPSELTAVIYLSKHTDTGISFYKTKKPQDQGDKQRLKFEYYYNPDMSKEKLKEIEEAKKFNNDLFEETVNVKGLYNRIVIFDSSIYHGAHVFKGKKSDDDRFIMVNIIYSVFDETGTQIKYPVSESKRM